MLRDLLTIILAIYAISILYRGRSAKPRDTHGLLQETSDGVFTIDERGLIDTANQQAASIFGISSKKLKKKSLVRPNAQGFSFTTLDSENSIAARTLMKGESFRGKARLLLENGDIRYLGFSSSPFYHKKKLAGAIVIFHDITTDTIREQELIEHHQKLHSRNTNLEEQLVRDRLTGCLNKNYYDYFMSEKQLYWAKQENYSMFLIDLDDFKMINDRQGHLVGDETLRKFGAFLISFFRKTDKIIRYGGDEFVCLLPETNRKTAEKIADNLLQALENKEDLGVRISIGIATLGNQDSADTWFGRADRALYQVKNSGKGSVASQPAENPQELQEIEVLES